MVGAYQAYWMYYHLDASQLYSLHRETPHNYAKGFNLWDPDNQRRYADLIRIYARGYITLSRLKWALTVLQVSVDTKFGGYLT